MSAGATLITGFGPFPGVERNPSGWLVQVLARTLEMPLISAVLPVSWQGAWAALEPLLDGEQPRQIILFGVSGTAHGFCLEQRAYNAGEPRRDAAGVAPTPGSLVPGAGEILEATLPVQPIASALARNGIPTALSTDPGRYLCNAVMFHALHWARRRSTRVGFVHIPRIGAEAPLAPADALAGARLVIETAARADADALVTD